MAHFIERDGVRIHYLEHPGPQPPLILIHGLTANAHCFDGLIAAGLSEFRGSLAIDLRGRGLSDKPASGYTPAEHAADVIALLDHHGLDQAVVCGHSYGGLVSLELATQHPDRIAKVVLIDIGGPTVQNPAVFELIKPSLDRLGKVLPSLDAFLDTMRRRMPFLAEVWDESLERYFRADVEELPDGTVRVRTPPEVIQQVIAEAQKIDWHDRMAQTRQPALMLHADGPYGPPGTPPIVLEEQAREAVEILPNAEYVHIPGNHLTMVIGANAAHVVAAIRRFASA